MMVKLDFVMQRLKKISNKIFVIINKDGGGPLLDFMGGHSCYEGDTAVTRENPDVPYNSPVKICYISPHHQYSNIFMNYKLMNIGDSTNNNDNKVHARKGES